MSKRRELGAFWLARYEKILEPPGLRSKILLWYLDLGAQLGRGMPGPSGIIKDRAGQRDHIGFPGGHDRLGLVKTGDQSDGNDGNSNGCFNNPSQRHLIARSHGNLSRMEPAA